MPDSNNRSDTVEEATRKMREFVENTKPSKEAQADLDDFRNAIVKARAELDPPAEDDPPADLLRRYTLGKTYPIRDERQLFLRVSDLEAEVKVLKSERQRRDERYIDLERRVFAQEQTIRVLDAELNVTKQRVFNGD